MNSRISFIEILKVYFKFIFLFFKTIKILREKITFLLKKKDCRNILEKKLILSYFGYMQNQIIKGLALKKYFKYD